MKVQKISVSGREAWILLDDNYQPVKEVNQYARFMHITKFSPNTIRTYLFALMHFYKFLNIRGWGPFIILEKDGPTLMSLLLEFCIYLEDSTYGEKVKSIIAEPRVSDASISNYLSAVLGFYEFQSNNTGAFSFNRLTPNPKYGYMDFLSELSQTRKTFNKSFVSRKRYTGDPEYIDRSEFNLLLSNCKTYRDKALLGVLFEGGLRISEALGLRLEDLQLEDLKIHVRFREDNENGARVKNHAERVAFVTPSVASNIALMMTNESLKYRSEYVFVNYSGPNIGRACTANSAWQALGRIGARTEINVHPHMLRHGFAVERIEEGVDLEQLALLMGHKDISSTRIYSHISRRYEAEKLRPQLDSNFNEISGG